MQSIGSTEVKVKAARAKSNGSKIPRKTTKAKETLHIKTARTTGAPSESELAEMIATAAYFQAEHRRFEPGHELDDWLAAEKQVRGTLKT